MATGNRHTSLSWTCCSSGECFDDVDDDDDDDDDDDVDDDDDDDVDDDDVVDDDDSSFVAKGNHCKSLNWKCCRSGVLIVAVMMMIC